MATYTVTLSDGTELSNLKVNGNNFISPKKLAEETFEGKLDSVTVTSSDGEIWEMGKSELVQISEGGKWFILREYSEADLKEMALQATIAELQATVSAQELKITSLGSTMVEMAETVNGMGGKVDLPVIKETFGV